MPVGGYDPSDLDERLAELATERELRELLTDAERAAYESGERGLFDLLSWSDIETILERAEGFDTDDLPDDGTG